MATTLRMAALVSLLACGSCLVVAPMSARIRAVKPATMPHLATFSHHAQSPMAVRAEVQMQMGQLPRGAGPGGFDPRELIGPAVFAFLLGTGALGWIFNLFSGFFLFILVVPLVAGPVFNWWLSNNLLEGTCATASHIGLWCTRVTNAVLTVAGAPIARRRCRSSRGSRGNASNAARRCRATYRTACSSAVAPPRARQGWWTSTA